MAEVAVATDAQLALALDPAFERLSPRVVLEVLVAGDLRAMWELRRHVDPDAYEERWHDEGCLAEPGEWRIAMVAGFLRRLAVGDEELTPVLVANLAWMLQLAADELTRDRLQDRAA